jgi:hypothetical protein
LDGLHKEAASCATPADSRLLILETLSRLGAGQLELLIAKHLEQPDFERLIRYDFQAALRRLGEIQPRRAAEVWLKSLPGTVAFRRHLAPLIEPWMQKAPKDFVAWHGLQSDEAQRAMASIVGQFAFSQPERFAEFAEAFSTSPLGGMAARRALEGFRVRGSQVPSVEEGLEFARKMPEGRLRSAALVSLLDWPGVDPTGVPELQAAMGALPFAAREAKAVQFISKIQQLEPGPFRLSVIAAAMAADAGKDAGGALKRLKAMEAGPEYSAAARGYVEAVADRDPAAALDVCLTIPKGDEQRAIALEEAASHLFRKKPDQARKWVEQAAITAEEYFHLTGRKR